jgi:hypothetical protein
MRPFFVFLKIFRHLVDEQMALTALELVEHDDAVRVGGAVFEEDVEALEEVGIVLSQQRPRWPRGVGRHDAGERSGSALRAELEDALAEGELRLRQSGQLRARMT